MIGQKLRNAAVALSVLAFASPTPAFGCSWWKSCFGGSATTTYYTPYTAAYAPPAAPCCGQATTVNYMPQTSYRTVYVNQPVVSYYPTTACNACGGATTVMRP